MKEKVRILQLHNDLRSVIRPWDTMTAVAREFEVTKQAVYDALLNETCCGGYYWMREDKWKMREAARNDSRKNE